MYWNPFNKRIPIILCTYACINMIQIITLSRSSRFSIWLWIIGVYKLKLCKSCFKWLQGEWLWNECIHPGYKRLLDGVCIRIGRHADDVLVVKACPWGGQCQGHGMDREWSWFHIFVGRRRPNLERNQRYAIHHTRTEGLLQRGNTGANETSPRLAYAADNAAAAIFRDCIAIVIICNDLVVEVRRDAEAAAPPLWRRRVECHGTAYRLSPAMKSLARIWNDHKIYRAEGVIQTCMYRRLW